jgi:hypothetical protein
MDQFKVPIYLNGEYFSRIDFYQPVTEDDRKEIIESVVEIMGREKYNEIRIGRDSYIANFGELSVFVKSE